MWLLVTVVKSCQVQSEIAFARSVELLVLLFVLAYEVRELLRNVVCHVGGQLLYVLRRGVYLKDVLYLDYHLSATIIFNRPTRWVVNRTDIVFLLVLIDVLTCLIQMIGVL